MSAAVVSSSAAVRPSGMSRMRDAGMENSFCSASTSSRSAMQAMTNLNHDLGELAKKRSVSGTRRSDVFTPELESFGETLN